MRLTRGEGWWLLRRRTEMTQSEMIALQGISEERYRRWELDRELAPMPARANSGALVKALTDGEWCALQRRRRGWTLPEAAARMGISRQTLWKAEWDRTLGVARVRRFYERLGTPRPTTAAPIRLAG